MMLALQCGVIAITLKFMVLERAARLRPVWDVLVSLFPSISDLGGRYHQRCLGALSGEPLTRGGRSKKVPNSVTTGAAEPAACNALTRTANTTTPAIVDKLSDEHAAEEGKQLSKHN